MKNLTLKTAVTFISLATMVLFSLNGLAQNNDKITICHYPPGNPDNPQTITINPNALEAHLAHGDHIGICDDLEQEELLRLKAGPNPYSVQTKIQVELSKKSVVNVQVINFEGNIVKILDSGEKEAGIYEHTFSGKEQGFSSGLYLIKVSAENETEYAERSMTIIEME